MSIFLFLLHNLPSILQAIMGIEAAVTAPGATKKAMVMDSLAIAAKVGETVPEAHVAAVSAMVDSVVGSLNASGVFSHKTSTAASGGTAGPNPLAAAVVAKQPA